jgi:hypothetical protein
MSFTLNLGFGGLCLFVPDVDAGGRRLMHVLLPAGHDHRAFLVHDLSALIGGPPTDLVLQHPLAGRCVDLTSLATSTALQPPPSSVADLAYLKLSVPRRLLDGACLPEELESRLTFAAGTSTIDYCASGAFWEFNGERQLPIRVVWSLTLDAEELVFDVVAPSSPSKRITLKPYQGVLNLWAFYLPTTTDVQKLPPVTRNKYLAYDEKAEHFAAFFHLLKGGYDNEPRFRKPEVFPGPLPSCYDPRLPGLDVTCVAATAPAQRRS